MCDQDKLAQLFQDARRFIMYHKGAIEGYPLQTYASALLFSPTGSLIRKLFQHEEPEAISIRPALSDGWSACLQTLEGHNNSFTLADLVYNLALPHSDEIVTKPQPSVRQEVMISSDNIWISDGAQELLWLIAIANQIVSGKTWCPIYCLKQRWFSPGLLHDAFILTSPLLLA
jgi:hypothetical protein